MSACVLAGAGALLSTINPVQEEAQVTPLLMMVLALVSEHLQYPAINIYTLYGHRPTQNKFIEI